MVAAIASADGPAACCSGSARAALVVLGLLSFAPRTYWSPYYRVGMSPDSPNGSVAISVNGRPHQRIMPLSYLETNQTFRFQPYPRSPGNPLDDVLIIGAGSGNDVAIALSRGRSTSTRWRSTRACTGSGATCTRTTRTRIPGLRAHRGRARVPARHRSRYDLILYAIPDSLTVLAGQSSLRLESYLFTEEAMREIRDHLEPDGVVSMYHYYLPVVVDRYAGTLDRVFGVTAVPRHGRRRGTGPRTVLTVSSERTTSRARRVEPACRRFPTGHRRHPFPYLVDAEIPASTR